MYNDWEIKLNSKLLGATAHLAPYTTSTANGEHSNYLLENPSIQLAKT